MILKPSLINSFRTANMLNAVAVRQFPGETRDAVTCLEAMELYLFMEPDARYWLGEFNRSLAATTHAEATLTLFDHLIHRDSLSDFQRLAKELVDVIQPSGVQKPQVRPIAFATYLPQAAASDEGSRLRAARAIAGIIRLAVEVRKVAKSYELPWSMPVIELVCGSRTDGVMLTSENCFSFRVDNLEEEAIRRGLFLDVISEAITIAGLAPKDLKIALELEPGELFLLRDDQTLRAFLSEIQSRDELAQHVGFNLDISHWILAGVDLNLLREPEIAERIYHSHVGGHSHRGHLGDMNLARIKPEMRDRVLNYIAAVNATWSTFTTGSGFISMEYEAAYGQAEVDASLSTLVGWLESVNQAGPLP